MNVNNCLIPYLEEIKEIRQIEQRILKETNIPVVDISHWNSGNMYKESILSQYSANTSLNITDYHYGDEYDNNIKLRVLQRLIESTENNFNCVLINNATSAI